MCVWGGGGMEGPTFPRGCGSNCIFINRPIERDFTGDGVRTPAPSPGSARGIVN